ncbi:UPF0426 protein At1g28150, chloroplastic [Primulina tabacum]|uniref:UPF0426 protein At1g28150, chloroplastic n=1 Tax=Primulina tabacum TaxID=48773 RepID=UPI003F5983B9
MALLVVPSVSSVPVSPIPLSYPFAPAKQLIFTSNRRYSRRSDVLARRGGFRVGANMFDPSSIQPPILKEALKEPVAFVGGIFAGLLRLDLNEEPLKEWVSRTVQAAGLSMEEIGRSDGVEAEETVPQQIEIE